MGRFRLDGVCTKHLVYEYALVNLFSVGFRFQSTANQPQNTDASVNSRIYLYMCLFVRKYSFICKAGTETNFLRLDEDSHFMAATFFIGGMGNFSNSIQCARFIIPSWFWELGVLGNV
jgi:hypothetical protein